MEQKKETQTDPIPEEITDANVRAEVRSAGIDLPEDNILDEWIKLYRRIFLLPFVDKSICIIRPITRGEMKRLTSQFRARIAERPSPLTGSPMLSEEQTVAAPGVQNNATVEDTQLHEEELAAAGLLFPSLTVEELGDTAPAGWAPTIYTAILQVSGFQLADDPIQI